MKSVPELEKPQIPIVSCRELSTDSKNDYAVSSGENWKLGLLK